LAVTCRKKDGHEKFIWDSLYHLGALMKGVGEYKAKKGLIRVAVLLDENGSTVQSVRITGDFFMYPEEALWYVEENLLNTSVSELEARIRNLFRELNIALVGSTVEDFLEAFRKAIENARRGGGG